MNSQAHPVLVTADYLNSVDKQARPKLVYVGKPEKFAEGHIAGSQQIEHSSLNLGLQPVSGHLPPLEHLETLFRNLGLANTDHVIAYDDEAGTAAARLFWVLHAMGHRAVSFLDGGISGWKAAGYELVTTPAARVLPSDWQAKPDPDVVATKSYLFANLDNPEIQILDARSAEEHQGVKSASDRKGRIPGSVNLNWLDTRDTDNANVLKHTAALQAMLVQRGFDPKKEIVAHCQTHQRSSHSYMMLKSLGYENVRGFAGSWSEWAADPAMPVV